MRMSGLVATMPPLKPFSCRRFFHRLIVSRVIPGRMTSAAIGTQIAVVPDKTDQRMVQLVDLQSKLASPAGLRNKTIGIIARSRRAMVHPEPLPGCIEAKRRL